MSSPQGDFPTLSLAQQKRLQRLRELEEGEGLQEEEDDSEDQEEQEFRQTVVDVVQVQQDGFNDTPAAEGDEEIDETSSASIVDKGRSISGSSLGRTDLLALHEQKRSLMMRQLDERQKGITAIEPRTVEQSVVTHSKSGSVPHSEPVIQEAASMLDAAQFAHALQELTDDPLSESQTQTAATVFSLPSSDLGYNLPDYDSVESPHQSVDFERRLRIAALLSKLADSDCTPDDAADLRWFAKQLLEQGKEEAMKLDGNTPHETGGTLDATKFQREIAELREGSAARDAHLGRIYFEVRAARRNTAILNEQLREWEVQEEAEAQRRKGKHEDRGSAEVSAQGSSADEEALRRQNARMLMLEQKITLAEDNLRTLHQTFLDSPNLEVLSHIAQTIEQGSTNASRSHDKFGGALARSSSSSTALRIARHESEISYRKETEPIEVLSRKARLNTVRDIHLFEAPALSAEDLKALGESLQVSSTLHALSVVRTPASHAGISLMAENGLRDNHRLQSLTLDSCNLTVDAAIAVFRAVASSKISTLGMCRNLLGQQATSRIGESDNSRDLLWTEMVECLEQAVCLRKFRFASNGLGLDGLAAICDGIEHGRIPNLHTLDLSGNIFGEPAGLMLAKMLSPLHAPSSITQLSLWGCFLGSKGIEELCDRGLRNNQSLRVLSLRGNNMCLSGASALAAILEQGNINLDPIEQVASTSQLTKLDVSANDLGPEGCKVIANALASNSSLEWLDLSLNAFGDDGCEYLAQYLTNSGSQNVEELLIDANQIGEKGARVLASALSKPTCNLTQLDISCNQITQAGLESLLAVVQQRRGHFKSIRAFGNALQDVDDLCQE